MIDNYRVWLLLEKSDETRISKSTVGYRDRTGEIYHFDSLVPNHKNISKNDLVIVRKENVILGLGTVHVINSEEGTKNHKRCPKCDSTDVRERLIKIPKWKCGGCTWEFITPKETSQIVTNFEAIIKDFIKFSITPTVQQVKTCATSDNGVGLQNSIISLDKSKINLLLAGLGFDFLQQDLETNGFGQGFGLTSKERKVVELQAMQVVYDLYFEDGWHLVDTSLSQPYDYLATKGNQRRFIEVKGTTGIGQAVFLTYREVENARLNPNSSALVVVSNITIDRSNEEPIASGGVISIHRYPWTIDDIHLKSIQFRYELHS